MNIKYYRVIHWTRQDRVNIKYYRVMYLIQKGDYKILTVDVFKQKGDVFKTTEFVYPYHNLSF